MTFSFLSLIYITTIFSFVSAVAVPAELAIRDDSSTRYDHILKSCTIFDPPDHVASLAQCKDICGDSVAKAKAADQISSISCISIGEPKWDTQNGTCTFIFIYYMSHISSSIMWYILLGAPL
jgi:hypothetical protein